MIPVENLNLKRNCGVMRPDINNKVFTFRSLYLFVLLAILVCLPLSKYLASAAQILLLLVWLAEGRFSEKWKRLKNRPSVWIFSLVFLTHLAGMIYTRDLAFGVHDLKIKLPLLILPFIIGSIEPLTPRELRLVLGGFVSGIIAGSLISISIIFGITHIDYFDERQTNLFISHIRFALMTALAVFILFFYVADRDTGKRMKLVIWPLILYLTGFLFILKSRTGVVVLILGGLVLAVRRALKEKDLLLKWFLIVGVVTVPLFAAFYISNEISRFYTIRESRENPDRLTARGNPYWHDYNNPDMENGYYVGMYQCETEMREAWNQLSTMPYDGPDLKGQELKYTLWRYLTSLGLRKDAYGISQLKEKDVRLIEKGYASCIYRDPTSFRSKIYETIWEYDHYKKGGNPGGHSVIQRIEFLKTGWAIFIDHPVLGVGTGDTKQAFEKKYVELNSKLDPQYRLRAHNQFLTFMIAFGIIGFLVIMTGMVLPAIWEKRMKNYFVLMFFMVSFLSMLNEDTLETQAGMAFFTVFYCLFIFGLEAGPSQSPQAEAGELAKLKP